MKRVPIVLDWFLPFVSHLRCMKRGLSAATRSQASVSLTEVLHLDISQETTIIVNETIYCVIDNYHENVKI